MSENEIYDKINSIRDTVSETNGRLTALCDWNEKLYKLLRLCVVSLLGLVVLLCWMNFYRVSGSAGVESIRQVAPAPLAGCK